MDALTADQSEKLKQALLVGALMIGAKAKHPATRYAILGLLGWFLMSEYRKTGAMTGPGGYRMKFDSDKAVDTMLAGSHPNIRRAFKILGKHALESAKRQVRTYE